MRQAIYSLGRVIAIDPDDANALWEQSALLLQAGQERKAATALASLLGKRPTDALVMRRLGATYLALGQAEKAEKQLGAACAKAPEDPGTWLALAAFYRGTERDDLAMPALRKVAALGEVPRDFEAEAREEAHRKANALKRELSMRGGNRRALSLRERASGSDADPPESFLASSSSLRVLNPEKSGRLRQNLARAAERAELDAQRALEAEKLRLQKVKGKGSFSERHKKASDFVDPNLRRARHVALAAMAAIFESHGQTGRAMEVYASMDQSDERVVTRQAEILTEAALKLQRTFRGKKAREAFERRRKTRRARRTYGSADGFANVNVFTQGSGVATNFAENRNHGTGAFGRSERSKPLGSSFF